jgi:putative methionine-R-sulfoxide reductase with GAF domain
VVRVTKAVKEYMSTHQQDTDAQELWQYFQEVIAWIQRVFPTYRHIMKGLDWGGFYNGHKDNKLNAAKLEKRIAGLIDDEEVDSKKGIYEYPSDRQRRKTLSLRTFDGKTTQVNLRKAKGICPAVQRQEV